MAKDQAYLEAEKKIEEALKSGAMELDLSVKYGSKEAKLTELPVSIMQLTQLQSLNLTNNKLTVLPDWLGQLFQLRSLRLLDNKLKELPNSLEQLLQLQLLDLRNNHLTVLHISFGQFTHLQSLKLSGNQLITLPESLGELTKLESLDLSKNKLNALPPSLGQLTRLTELNLSKNQLTVLPDSLGQLTRLKNLYLPSNKLTTLPDSLGQFTQLTSLDLSENQLTVLPDSLGQLTQLTALHLGSNRLTTLPDSLGRLTQLVMLDLTENQLTILPDSLGQLTQLRQLYLSRNQLTTLPDSLGQLTQLTSLNLSNNGLTALPDSLGQLTQLTSLDLSNNQLTTLPPSLEQLTQLTELNLSYNQLTALPDSLGQLTQLTSLDLQGNQLTTLPELLGQLTQLQVLHLRNNKLASLPESLLELIHLGWISLDGNQFTFLPEWIGNLSQITSLWIHNNHLTVLPNSLWKLQNITQLYLGRPYGGNPLGKLPSSISHLLKIEELHLSNCNITDLPPSLAQLENLKELTLDNNPLNPALQSAYEQGLDAVKAYLRAQAEGEIKLNEAKLILVGEGGVGKTSLLSALRGDPWVESRETTHGVEVAIKSLVVQDSVSGKEVTLNGWDFGGQNIYRHTHQLFFTSPAVYLAVWDPRRGPEQCAVNEWVKMIKHRAYDENRHEERPRILVVATKGGPKERLDHIDEQALRDEFGDLICGFYHVDSKPDENGVCYQLDELKQAIAREAASIPSVGRSVPTSWKNVLEAVRRRSEHNPYISYERFEALCNRQKVPNDLASLYATILNELGHLIYYRGDDTLKDTVILRPDYLSKAISFVLEDKVSKDYHGLVKHTHLNEIWNDPARSENERYPKDLHPIFIRLMEKFDLSYQVTMPELAAPPTSLIAQLVPNLRPDDWLEVWGNLNAGDVERTQVCRVLDAETGRTTEVDGLVYRLIVRLHRYSLGRKNYYESRHWKTGLLLDDGYNGRAFIEEIGGDIYVKVRAAYPERFLHQLCTEIQWLVDNFWKGLDAKLFVPCPTQDCKGLLEIEEMLDNRRNGMEKVRCSVCRTYHEIDPLMATMQPKPVWDDAVAKLRNEQRQILRAVDIGFNSLSTQIRVLMSQADEQYEELLRWLSDPAKDGPRLFSFEPANRSNFDPRSWTKEKFKLTLWCEHSKLPLPQLNGKDSKKGVYEVEFTREWFKEAAPVLLFVTNTLSLVLPIASAGLKLAVADEAYKAVEKQLDLSKEIIGASLTAGSKAIDWVNAKDNPSIDKDFRVDESALRSLHAFLKAQDPTFGGLARVQNKRREFLWVHEKYASEY